MISLMIVIHCLRHVLTVLSTNVEMWNQIFRAHRTKELQFCYGHIKYDMVAQVIVILIDLVHQICLNASIDFAACSDFSELL